MTTCPECGNKLLTIDHEIVCSACSLVIDDSPITHHEPMHAPASHPGLATAGTNQYRGRIIKPSWLLSTREKNLQRAKAQISLLASNLKLPERICVQAQLLFKQAADHNLTRGRDNQSFAYASIYAACIMQEMPKTPLEVIAYSNVSKKKMLRAYRQLNRSLGLRHKPIHPTELLQRFGSRLQLPQATITHAAVLLERITPKGTHPETIAAAALYIATKHTGEHRTQRAVANTTGVIEVTIRKFARTFNTEETPCR